MFGFRSGVKDEGAYEANDTIVIEKADGGFVKSDEAYMEFGLLHMDKENWTFPPYSNHQPYAIKSDVYGPSREGYPLRHEGQEYYILDESDSPFDDPMFINVQLLGVFEKSSSGITRMDQAERASKRRVNTIMAGFAAAIVALSTLGGSNLCAPDVYVTVQEAEVRGTMVPPIVPRGGE